MISETGIPLAVLNVVGTDDGQHYEYVYDAFGRLRKVNRTDNQNLVSEYWYNGLGFRIGWKYDTDSDNDVDSNDKRFNFAYDERWRVVGIFRDSDASPKELFVYHNAGADGYGSSSYIDAVILRDKDANTAWASAAGDSVLEQRRYYCQNWRADVIALISDVGGMVEQDRYGEYGVPFGMPFGDVNGDGACTTADSTQVSTWAAGGAGSYDVRGDFDLDGDIDSADETAVGAARGVTWGWGKLSAIPSAGGNRKGYAGYEFDPVLAYSIWHVRHRVLNSDLGRWTRRDPIGYRGGVNLNNYVHSCPHSRRDPLGLQDGQSPGGPVVPLPPPWPTNYPSPESYQGECKPKKIAGPNYHHDRATDSGDWLLYRWSFSLSSSVWTSNDSLITDNAATLKEQWFPGAGYIWEPWTTVTHVLTTSHKEFVIIFCYGETPLYAKFGQPTDFASNEYSSLRSDISIGASDAQAPGSLTLAVNTGAAEGSNVEINIGGDTIGITYSGADTVLALDMGSYTWKCECPCDKSGVRP